MASDNTRSRTTRDLAEAALVRLAVFLGPRSEEFVVIGGLNPDFLTENPPAPHMGTTDVDLLLEVGFGFERDELDFGWLQEAMENAGFEPIRPDNAWRWKRRMSGVLIKVDLLCEAFDNIGQAIALPGAGGMSAMNLAGPAPAAIDAYRRDFPVPQELRDEAGCANATVSVRFAGLGGYLLAKAAALLRRNENKDAYDLAYVLLYNSAGGPRPAASAALAAVPQDGLRDYLGDLKEGVRRFLEVDRTAARTFAAQMVDSGDETSEAILVQDAIGAATQFLSALDEADA